MRSCQLTVAKLEVQYMCTCEEGSGKCPYCDGALDIF